MGGAKLMLEGPALIACGVMLLALVFNVVGDAILRHADARRRAAQRDRELAMREAFDALRHPRPADTTTTGRADGCP